MEGDSQTWFEFRSTRHAKYWCGYHFVWIPKYRRDVLVSNVAEYTREVLMQILLELGCKPIAIEVLYPYFYSEVPENDVSKFPQISRALHSE